MKQYAVHTPNRKDYSRLMDIYCKVGFQFPSYDYLAFTGLEMCVTMSPYHFRHRDKDEFISKGYTILSVDHAEAKLKELYPNELNVLDEAKDELIRIIKIGTLLKDNSQSYFDKLDHHISQYKQALNSSKKQY